MSLFIKPVNRTLLVKREPVQEKKNDLGIIVPFTTTTKIENNVVVTLVAAEPNSSYEKYESQKLLVRASMLEDIEFRGTVATFLSESGVIAIIAESEFL